MERGRPLPAAVARELAKDPRPGARALLEAAARRRTENRSEGQRLRHMLRYENQLWEQGLVHVAGLDEAGMSPLAGPVAAAAVVLPRGWRAPYVNDSKQVDPARREFLGQVIKAQSLYWAVSFVEPEEIDRINIYWAGILAMKRALAALGVVPDHLLIDARSLKDIPIPQTKLVKGDERSLCIAAASILAKTERDARMRDYDAKFSGYGFGRHKGYPVREHVAALQRLGPCPIHRLTFAPVRAAAGLPPLAPSPLPLEREPARVPREA